MHLLSGMIHWPNVGNPVCFPCNHGKHTGFPYGDSVMGDVSFLVAWRLNSFTVWWGNGAW